MHRQTVSSSTGEASKAAVTCHELTGVEVVEMRNGSPSAVLVLEPDCIVKQWEVSLEEAWLPKERNIRLYDLLCRPSNVYQKNLPPNQQSQFLTAAVVTLLLQLPFKRTMYSPSSDS